MRKNLKVLTVQFEAVLGDKDANLKKLAKLLKENADAEADVVILPEVFSLGADYDNWQAQAEFIPGQTTMLLSGLAELYNTNIIGGSFIEKTYDGKFYNTCIVVDRSGAVVAQYRKNHLFAHNGSRENEFLDAGDSVINVELDGVKFGLALCYDIRFPELFRKMVQNGTEVFVIPAAFPQERIAQWNILNQARALENQAFLISCNQFGCSNIVSPKGEILAQTDVGEVVTQNIINLDEISKIRTNTPYLADMKL